MNFDFSIESSLEKIQNTNTKEYFKEVYQTFVNGNYRSATVMLYSVLICDLVYKLRDLRDIYGDSKAIKILDEIETMQANNPNSPEWESKLVELIKNRTTLLEPSDVVAIESLQKFRHLSAHPVLNNSDLLYSPNRDTVQSLIRNILEGVLTNPPFFSSKIFDSMLSDLIEVMDKLTDDEGLEKYIMSRYVKRLKETDFSKIFRSLWKVVFIVDTEEASAGRKINYKVLNIFIKHNKSICIELVRNEPHYYSNINKDEHISRIIVLLCKFPKFYFHLDTAIKQLIISKTKTECEYRFVAWFLKPSLEEHISTLDTTEYDSISSKAFNLMRLLCKQSGIEKQLNDFAIEYFGASNSFDKTQNRFDNVIDLIHEDFTLDQIKRLLEVSQNNYQIYQRIGMKSKLSNIAEKYDDEIDKSDYPKIFSA